MSFVIEKNIEMPKVNVKWPFKEMDIGDSFFTVEAQHRIRAAASLHGVRNLIKFKVHRVEENGVMGCRVWRVK